MANCEPMSSSHKSLTVGLALVTVAWLLVAVLTTLYNVASSQRFFLTPFVLAWAELALLAATVYARSRVGWRRKLFPGLGEYLVVAGWAALFTVVGLRLLAAAHFNGHVALWDFGPKADGGENVAFVPEFNSFSHSVQGALVLLQFPVMDVILRHWVLVAAADLGSLFVVVYPVYNVVKRTARSADTFASSSFCNNGFEWAYGFLLGLTLGGFLEAALFTTKRPAHLRPFGWFNKLVAGARCVFGFAILMTALWAAALYAKTWDEPPAEPPTSASTANAVAMVVLAAAIILATMLLSVNRHRRQEEAEPRDASPTARQATTAGKQLQRQQGIV